MSCWFLVSIATSLAVRVVVVMVMVVAMWCWSVLSKAAHQGPMLCDVGVSCPRQPIRVLCGACGDSFPSLPTT